MSVKQAPFFPTETHFTNDFFISLKLGNYKMNSRNLLPYKDRFQSGTIVIIRVCVLRIFLTTELILHNFIFIFILHFNISRKSQQFFFLISLCASSFSQPCTSVFNFLNSKKTKRGFYNTVALLNSVGGKCEKLSLVND